MSKKTVWIARVFAGLGLAGLVLLAASTLLPWITVPGGSVAGCLTPDGKAVLGLSLAAIAVLAVGLALRTRHSAFLLGPLAWATVAALWMAAVLWSALSFPEEVGPLGVAFGEYLTIGVGVGVGLYLAVAGGAVAAVALGVGSGLHTRGRGRLRWYAVTQGGALLLGLGVAMWAGPRANRTPADNNTPAAVVRLLRAPAEAGDVYAQYGLATCLYHGWGAKNGLSKGLELYRKAADQGHAAAQHNLGWSYYYGCGRLLPEDREAAVKWFRKAA